MAALVQTLPSPTTASMMSGRPSSAQGLPHGYRQSSAGRYKAPGSTGYRGMPPYAFTTTPQLSTASSRAGHQQQQQQQQQQQSLNSFGRDSSTFVGPLSLDFSNVPALDLSLPTPTASASSNTSAAAANYTATAAAATAVAKPSPDRYRRNARRVDSGDSDSSRTWTGSAAPSGSGMAAVGSLYKLPSQTGSSSAVSQYQTYRGSTYATPAQPAKTTSDDAVVSRSATPELAARYRRRSLGSIDTAGLNHAHDGPDAASPHPNLVIQQQQQQQASSPSLPLQRPSPAHAHKLSGDSVVSSHSAHSSRSSSAFNNDKAIASPAPAHVQPAAAPAKPDARHLAATLRSNESAGRRMPSPLSKPVDLGASEPFDETPRRIGRSTPRVSTSPAAEQLSSINESMGKKPRSKLRRAFSFGSTTELRKATAQASLEKSVAAAPGYGGSAAAAAAAAAAKRNSKYEGELEPEQARIAEKQEAAGLGESIYSGQGNFFTGSTDNLSISSTASSASLMLRKMGHGVKKGTRSLVGLFRPKSIIGPSSDGPTAEAPAAQVSIVNVEAERETARPATPNGAARGTASGALNGSINEHLEALNRSAGGAASSSSTNSVKLERDSIDTGKFSADSATVSSDSRSRRSIVGGEKERAEVLAAVKKGILKRSDSNQPSPRLAFRQSDFSLSPLPALNDLPALPALNDSPRSSAPSTPAGEPAGTGGGERRSDSVANGDSEADGYFAHFTTLDSMSVGSLTPQTMMRNISFSPRIQFHDTWPSAEYDRRGDIATCNRLTPMLAQQIKEELNTFKMEMEVHESSKVYTHFF